MAALVRIRVAAALLCLLWVAAVAPARAQPALDFGRYFALVIGNNGYRHLPKLATAGNDARALADLLRARYGFEVELLLDADRDQLVQAINSYRASLKDGDNLLIYYAGHGLIDEPTERGFWLPVDAQPGNEARWLDVALVSSNLRAMQARHILVIADSCYSGSLMRAPGAAGLDDAAVLQRIRDRRARMALTSGSLEPVVDGVGTGHSIFAGALLKVLRENVGILTGAELFARLRARVVAGARQTPLYADIRFTGHEGGDFVFVPRGAEIAAAPQAPAETEAAIELAFWNSIKDSLAADDYRAYLDAFPSGRFAPLARRRAELQVAAKPEPSLPARPRPAQASPKLAVAPAAQPAEPAITDEAGLAQRWREISIILRRQYDAGWALSDFAHYLSNLGSYRVESLTADEIALKLDYVVQEISPNGGPGFPRPRQNTVRFRNRAPGFAILQWGKAVAESSLANAAQFDIHWEQIRDRLMAQYDRHVAIADGAFDMAELTAYRLERIDGEEIVLGVDYIANPINAAAGQPEARTARLRLRNRAPDYRILQWGNLPPPVIGDDGAARGRLVFSDAAEARQFSPILRRALERQYLAGIRFRPTESVAAADSGPPDTMFVKRHEVTALASGELTIAVTYEVSSGGSTRRDRDATVTLRNEGPAFEIVDWQRR
jgi:hypothetical protein